jgi:hypothetical protein
MALSLNLTKGEQSLKLCLQKSGVVTPPRVDVAFVLDVSGSFDDEHRQGVTDALLARLVPWGMTFDPDGKLEVFTFSSGARTVARVGSVTPANYAGYVRREIVARVPGYGGGTDYSYVLEDVLKAFGWMAQGGLLKRIFGGTEPQAPGRRGLVLFVTDGENSDHARTAQVLAQSQQRGDAVYFLFIGISNQGGSFPFLRELGERFDNTGLTVIRNLRLFTAQDDDALNTGLLQPELIDWFKRDQLTGA